VTRNRTATLITAALLAGLVIAPSCLAAPAGSLLSGYGGPGAGDQAILGSALVGGAGGGGGGDRTSGGAGAGGSATGGGLSATSQTAPRGNGERSGGTKGGHGASGGASATYKDFTSSPSAAVVPTTEEAGALGLTGSDLLILLLVAGGLVLIGAVTRRLARAAPSAHR
jgi:hypothetical protein